MNLEYALMDPTGNTTILVSSPVPAQARPDAAARLMAHEPAAEQAGFLSGAGDGFDIAVDMAGGEFCGNATMSAAVYHAIGTGMERGTVTVRVSGAEAPVPVSLERRPDGSYAASLEMPRPLSVAKEAMPDGQHLPIVRFPGIAHGIVEHAQDRARAEAEITDWCRALGADALGLMFLDREAGTLTPLVYVPDADTLFWENACASGTAAVGAYLARESGKCVRLSLRQPGGVLSVEAAPASAPILSGTVRLLRRATFSYT